MEAQLVEDIRALRWQSGFFSFDGVALLAPLLEQLRRSNSVVRGVIGSNNAQTTAADVTRLLNRIGIPRAGAHLGIVSYAAGLYHPKVYHFQRADGTQCAYVGSANLTAAGVSGLNIESGIVLDTRDGDTDDVVSQVAASVDGWFQEERDGFHAVADADAVARLLADGVLSVTPPQPTVREISEDVLIGPVPRGSRNRLRPLITLPRDQPAIFGPLAAVVPQTANPVIRPTVARDGFPPYLIFDPDADAPTVGTDALSGAALPNGAAGLIIRLNRDNGRHFAGRPGTSNLSIPVATLGALRFGIRRGKYLRPRAQFMLRIRYMGIDRTIVIYPVATNIMAYGFVPGERSHGDVRMVIPASVRQLADEVRRAGLPVPAEEDVAFVEWPTFATPDFRLTCLQRDSRLFDVAARLLAEAEAVGQLVGDGACWLPPDLVPPWD
jgi:hypothetical protein